MGLYTLHMPVVISGQKENAQVEFMYHFDINSQVSIEVDKIVYKDYDIFDRISPLEIWRISQEIKDTFYDWYDGYSE